MDRRQYLAGIGTASTAGLALLAGCSDDNTGTGGGDSGGNEGGGDGTSGGGFGTGAPTAQTGDATAGDEAIETGAPPPAASQTPFENTNTVPAEEGLETGQAPNRTASEEG